MLAAAAVVEAGGRDLRAVSADIRERLATDEVAIEHAADVHGLAGGLKQGAIVIEGDAGDYLGVLNDGARITVHGNAGRYVADNMTKGTVVVDGDAGYGVGQYCYGGTVVVRGNAGDFVATMNKGAVVIIGGNVGTEAATYMLDGDLVIVGNAGHHLGNYLIRGQIYIGGTWESLGNNTLECEMTDADVTKLRGYFEEHGITADPTRFRKICRLSEKPFYQEKQSVPRTSVRG